MEKLKTRMIVGWRQRENEVRRVRTRLRASTAVFKPAATPGNVIAFKKKADEPVT